MRRRRQHLKIRCKAWHYKQVHPVYTRWRMCIKQMFKHKNSKKQTRERELACIYVKERNEEREMERGTWRISRNKLFPFEKPFATLWSQPTCGGAFCNQQNNRTSCDWVEAVVKPSASKPSWWWSWKGNKLLGIFFFRRSWQRLATLISRSREEAGRKEQSKRKRLSGPSQVAGRKG